jgi:hypothetical protein
MSCPSGASLIPFVNGLEATERGHQAALAGAWSPVEARSKAAIYTRGFDELLGKLTVAWQQSGCP